MLSESAVVLRTEVLVVGGGLAGLTAAVALGGAGIATALVAPAAAPDGRTTALLAGSVAALGALGVWPRCRGEAAPLTAIRIIDDRPGLLRALEVAFQAADLELEAFGHNIPNDVLHAALVARAAELPELSRFEEPVVDLQPGSKGVRAHLASGRAIEARLAVAADGRLSLCRKAAGIGARTRGYGQDALTGAFRHTRPHRGESTEFHTAEGPFTLVPLPGQRSSLVWVMAPSRAEELARLDRAEFASAIERQSRSILGKVEVENGPQAYRLAGMSVERLGQNRVALVGEAAHLIPPIGAQGFNLGLRDAAAIAEIVVDAHRRGDDVGRDELLARYDAARRGDVTSRTVAVDLLNGSLLTGFLPLQGLRGLGLYALERVAPLRGAIMREGLGPRAGEPRLMRGEPL